MADESVLDESELDEPLDDPLSSDEVVPTDPEVEVTIEAPLAVVAVAIPPISAVVVIGPPA